MTRQLGWTAGILTCAVALAACAHSEAAQSSDVDRAALEAKARADLGEDPLRELDAGPPPQAEAPKPAPQVQSVDPRQADESALRTAAAGKDCPAIHAAISAHPGASPAAIRDALSAAQKCEERAKDLPAARQTALEELKACGPEGVDRCRARVLGQLKRLASAAPKDAPLLAKVKDIAEKDACVLKLEHQANGDAPLDACAGAASALYKRQEDALMHQRIKLARARHAAHKDEASAEKQLEDAADECQEPRCAGVRTKALDALASYGAAQKKPELVLAARLKQDEIAAAQLPPEKRAYVRGPKTDAACTALETAQGPGSCRAAEKRVTGRWTFHDWSAQEVPGDLPADQVLRANEDFAVTLQDCFRDEATRLPVPSTASYKVRWMVTNEGRADQVHLDPPANDAGPLAQCLRERFSTWRYPRSHGENQHVEQGFTISARPK